jgi:L-seryl-tRNA(Ser) seleniumtransferase
MGAQPSLQARIPAVGRLLETAAVQPLIAAHGREAVTIAIRQLQADLRAAIANESSEDLPQLGEAALAARIERLLQEAAVPSLRRVFNLTGTVLHTNLGRASLPREAIDAMVAVACEPSNLEFDLHTGKRGDRDSHVESLLCELTGAEAATVVNNNAAAVMLVLNTLARGREVLVSRGELVEIGGSFRIPDVMTRAGSRLVEVGTTNRTHLEDFAGAIGAKTAMVMKVHHSNFVMTGFVAAADETSLAELAHSRGLTFAVDLGSGTLVDLQRFGLPHEVTPSESLQHGADLVTFSGDKLLGGPQAGIIVGKRALIERIKRNAMKRALRLDKISIAALGAVLMLYRNPDALAQRLPTLRLLTRSYDDILGATRRVLPALKNALGPTAEVTLAACQSVIGSGSLPSNELQSAGFEIRPVQPRRSATAALNAIVDELRSLPIPVIGRVHHDALFLDLRCLEDEAAFVDQLRTLSAARSGSEHRPKR